MQLKEDHKSPVQHDQVWMANPDKCGTFLVSPPFSRSNQPLLLVISRKLCPHLWFCPMLWIPCFGWLRGFHFTICLSNLQQVKYGFQLVLFFGHHWRPCTFERAIIQRLSLATFFGVGSTNSLLLKSMGEAITRVSAQDYRCEDFFPEGTRYPPADSMSTSLAPAVTGTTRFGSDRPRWNSPIWRSFCRRNHGFSTSMLVYPGYFFWLWIGAGTEIQSHGVGQKAPE